MLKWVSRFLSTKDCLEMKNYTVTGARNSNYKITGMETQLKQNPSRGNWMFNGIDKYIKNYS